MNCLRMNFYRISIEMQNVFLWFCFCFFCDHLIPRHDIYWNSRNCCCLETPHIHVPQQAHTWTHCNTWQIILSGQLSQSVYLSVCAPLYLAKKEDWCEVSLYYFWSVRAIGFIYINTHTHIYIYIYIHLGSNEVHTISFQTLFVWALLLIVHMKFKSTSK